MWIFPHFVFSWMLPISKSKLYGQNHYYELNPRGRLNDKTKTYQHWANYRKTTVSYFTLMQIRGDYEPKLNLRATLECQDEISTEC